MMRKLIMTYLTVAFLFVLGSKSAAQSNKSFDSLAQEGSRVMYEHPEKSIEIGNQLYQLAGGNLKKRIIALVVISDAYSSTRDYRKSLEYLIKAKNIADKTDDPITRIRILIKTATQYHQLKIYDKALEYLDECMRIQAAHPEKKDSLHSLMGNNYIIRGFIYKDQLDCDVAISSLQQGIAEYLQVKDNIVNANLSITVYNIGNCQIKQARLVEAKQSFIKSMEYAKKVDAKSLLAFAAKGLAEVLTLEGKYQEAIKTLLEAQAISADVGDLILNEGIYKGLSENYLAVNDWAQYQAYHEKYLQTLVKNKESERKSVSDSLKEASETQNQRLDSAKSFYVCGIISLAVLSIAMLFVIFWMNKKSASRMLALQEKIKTLQKN